MSRHKSIVLMVCALSACAISLCQCYVWTAHETMEEARHEIEEADLRGMDNASRYHFDAAEGLLKAAEKQYEDADFNEATALAEQAEAQLDRSRKLRQFHDLFGPENPGGIE